MTRAIAVALDRGSGAARGGSTFWERKQEPAIAGFVTREVTVIDSMNGLRRRLGKALARSPYGRRPFGQASVTAMQRRIRRESSTQL